MRTFVVTHRRTPLHSPQRSIDRPIALNGLRCGYRFVAKNKHLEQRILKCLSIGLEEALKVRTELQTDRSIRRGSTDRAVV